MSSYVYAVGLQADGKIIVGGAFNTYNAVWTKKLARINTDGSHDTSFNVGASGANSDVYDVEVLPNGKTVIVGQFTQYQAVARNKIAVVNADGSLNTSFVPDATIGGSTYNAVDVQPDGRYIIGGFMAGHVARLNADGTKDTGFNSAISTYLGVYSLQLQMDGKIFAGGLFTTVGGASRNSIVRLNSNGSLDTSFDPGTGISTYVYALGMASNGSLSMGGDFTSYNGANAWRYKDIMAAPTSISLGTIATSSVTSSAFTASVGFYGDTNENAAVMLYYCDNTASPGCSPAGGSSAAMTATSGVYNGNFSAAISSGLVSGHTYNLSVTATDADGVSGSPATSTVTLP